MEEQRDQKTLFGQWRTRLSQALLREPAVVLLERDGDVPPFGVERHSSVHGRNAGMPSSL